MNKFKTILAVSIATALILSCAPAEDEEEVEGSKDKSSSSGSNSGNGPATETYTLAEYEGEDDGFTYFVPWEYTTCTEGGILETKKDSSEVTQYYSIENKIMTWGAEYDYMYGDTLMFKGTSDELASTWTRTKNKAKSCWLDDGGYEPGMYCKSNYDITKVVLTDSKVTFTRDVCLTDRIIDGEDYGNGWKSKIKDCKTVEISKGSDKVTLKITKMGEEEEVSYKGKSCKMYEPTKAQKQAACKEAWKEYQDENEYYSILRELDGSYYSYYKCKQDLVPDLFGSDEWYDVCIDEDGDSCRCDDMCTCYDPEEYDWYNWCDAAGKPALKAKAKISKLKPLLKKKK